jgi:hypothetical protein
MRPSISSDTPNFRLVPVNSTLVYRFISSIIYPYTSHSLLSSHQCQLCLRKPILVSLCPPLSSNRSIPAQQHDHLFKLVSILFLIIIKVICDSPLASKTCPDLCVPSGRVKVTISLYLGNLTCHSN